MAEQSASSAAEALERLQLDVCAKYGAQPLGVEPEEKVGVARFELDGTL